jgi:hypothetical protein
MTRPSLQYFRRLSAQAPRGLFWLFFTAPLFFSFGFSIFFYTPPTRLTGPADLPTTSSLKIRNSTAPTGSDV